MADVYVVLVKRGSGEIGGVFTLLADATAYVGVRPMCNYEIIRESIDTAVGANVNNQLQAGPVVKVSKKGDGPGNR